MECSTKLALATCILLLMIELFVSSTKAQAQEDVNSTAALNESNSGEAKGFKYEISGVLAYKSVHPSSIALGIAQATVKTNPTTEIDFQPKSKQLLPVWVRSYSKIERLVDGKRVQASSADLVVGANVEVSGLEKRQGTHFSYGVLSPVSVLITNDAHKSKTQFKTVFIDGSCENPFSPIERNKD